MLPCINARYMSDYKKRMKGLTQRMLLLGVNRSPLETKTIECTVLSATDKVYTITIFSSQPEIEVTCSCPDFCMRKELCKHIYWLSFKKLGWAEPGQWTQRGIEAFVKSNLPSMTIVGRNSECPICLEPIDYSNEMTICCNLECNNSVHAICWHRFTNASNDPRCVLCRSYSMPSLH